MCNMLRQTSLLSMPGPRAVIQYETKGQEKLRSLLTESFSHWDAFVYRAQPHNAWDDASPASVQNMSLPRAFLLLRYASHDVAAAM